MATAAIILALAVMLALMVRSLQRAFFYARPRGAPNAFELGIDAAIEHFEQTLGAHAPDVLEGLEPGLTDDEIGRIESRYRFRLTDELRALYRWRNGSGPEERIELIPGHWFVPLEYAAEERERLRIDVSRQSALLRLIHWVVAGHRSSWLSVLEDGSGDGYFYDPWYRRAGWSFFYHMAEDGQYRYFPALASFFAGATECYQSRIYRSGRRGASAEDYERSFELWKRYANWTRR